MTADDWDDDAPIRGVVIALGIEVGAVLAVTALVTLLVVIL